MNPITAIKLAGLADAAKSTAKVVGKVFHTSGNLGGAIGKELGSEAAGKAVGYVAPILAANYITNQYTPTRRAKAAIGQGVGMMGGHIGQALVPRDFGMRPGDYGAY